MSDDVTVPDDGIDEANPPEETAEGNPDIEEQNLPEGEDVPDDPDFHPDLPDTDDEEFVAEVEKGLSEDA